MTALALLIKDGTLALANEIEYQAQLDIPMLTTIDSAKLRGNSIGILPVVTDPANASWEKSSSVRRILLLLRPLPLHCDCPQCGST